MAQHRVKIAGPLRICHHRRPSTTAATAGALPHTPMGHRGTTGLRRGGSNAARAQTPHALGCSCSRTLAGALPGSSSFPEAPGQLPSAVWCCCQCCAGSGDGQRQSGCGRCSASARGLPIGPPEDYRQTPGSFLLLHTNRLAPLKRGIV